MLSLSLLRNEWRVLGRQPLLWVSLLSWCGFVLLMALNSPRGYEYETLDGLLKLNASLVMLVLPVLSAVLAPTFFLRDVDHGMQELVHVLPIPPRRWLSLRCGTLLATLVGACLLAQILFLSILAAQTTQASSVELLWHSVLWLLLMHVPACLLHISVLAWLSSRFSSSAVLYVACAMGWLTYVGLATVTDTPLLGGSIMLWPPLWQAMQVLDPYALTAFLNAPASIDPSRILSLVVPGRVLWLGLCLFLFSCIRAMPALREQRAKDSPALTPLRAQTGFVSLIPARPGWRTIRELVLLQVHYCLRKRGSLLLLAAWVLLFCSESLSGMNFAEALSVVDAGSRDALNRVAWDVLPLVGSLLLLYLSDSCCRLYPAHGMQELVAAVPLRNVHVLLAQVLSLAALLVLYLTMAAFAVMLAQFSQNSAIQPFEYLAQLGLQGSRLALFALLFVAVHGLLRSRLAANLVNASVVVLDSGGLVRSLGLQHPLWSPLDSPLQAPDAYWGFEGSLAGHVSFVLFWGCLCLSLVGLAMCAWHRNLGMNTGRWRALARSPVSVLLALLPLSGMARQGFYIHRHLADEFALATPRERELWQANYELAYAQWQTRAQPTITSVLARIDFYPSERRAEVHAELQLQNQTQESIDQILVNRYWAGPEGLIDVPGAQRIEVDASLRQAVVTLQEALAPGDSLLLEYENTLRQSGLQPAALPLILRPHFSYVSATPVFPVVGFQREFTLRDAETRSTYALPPLPDLAPSRLFASEETPIFANEMATLEAIISTESDQVTLSQGELLASWEQDGRRYSHFVGSGKLHNRPAYVSVPWQPQTRQVKDFTLQIFAPETLASDDPNFLGMQDTLLWLDEKLVPYPGRTLSMLATPAHGISGYALPQVLLIDHKLGFRATPAAGAGFSQVYRRAVHETSHQWFGHLLGHGVTEDRSLLVEGLAKYAELVMIEARYGAEALDALISHERLSYRLATRASSAPVVSLIDAELGHDVYSRATLAFASLRERLGDENILTALRQLTRKQQAGAHPATSMDFVKALQKDNPAAEAFIAELFLGTELGALLETPE